MHQALRMHGSGDVELEPLLAQLVWFVCSKASKVHNLSACVSHCRLDA